MDQRTVGGLFFRWGSLEEEVIFEPRPEQL